MASNNPQTLINHVAIIMDGNGRWANTRSHGRVWGHIRGSRVVSRIVEEAEALEIKALTMYAFSTENWSRPLKEIKTLFNLLRKFLLLEQKRIIDNQICFKVMGDISKLPIETKKIISTLEEKTRDAKGLKLTFAFGYGGRSEILYSVNSFIKKNPGKLISEEDLNLNLYYPESGDVDLLIRTGGDQRISNFLLWQMAYAEMFFTKTMWPDFSKQEFRSIIESVKKRERRFGNVGPESFLVSSVAKARKNINLF